MKANNPSDHSGNDQPNSLHTEASIAPGLRCTVLGGAGHSFEPGTPIGLTFSESVVTMRAAGSYEQLWYEEITDLQVFGPGMISSGGGFLGGGVGLEGAVEGMAIAGLLNALTTKTKMHTFISLQSHVGELHLHYEKLEPGALRIALSPVFLRLRRCDADWMARRRAVIAGLLRSGRIDEQQEQALLARLLGTQTAEIATLLTRSAPEALGRCPLCKKSVSLSAARCECGAVFGKGAWAPEPI